MNVFFSIFSGLSFLLESIIRVLFSLRMSSTFVVQV